MRLKSGFDEHLHEVRKLLDSCDECPNNRYHKVLPATEEHPFAVQTAPIKGHSLLCYTGTDCKSMLRILRVASTHYSKLNSFLRLVYAAMRGHRLTADLDEALLNSDLDHLKVVCGFET